MVFIWTLLFAHITYSIWVISRIYISIMLSKKQKIVNTIMVILIPFFWGVIVLFMIKPPKEGFASHKGEIEKERNIHYYESNKGIWPD